MIGVSVFNVYWRSSIDRLLGQYLATGKYNDSVVELFEKVDLAVNENYNTYFG